MLVLFPSDPFETPRPDEAWTEEIRVAREAGHKVAYVHWEGVVQEDAPDRACRHVRKRDGPNVALYRGWMLSVEDYGKLHAALVRRNVWLVNAPDQYQTCHHFDGWYETLEERTPRSAWVEGRDVEGAVRLVEEFDGPCVVRDFVKSRKHEWGDACFVESPADARRVVRNFVERQGESLVGGIVVRQFVKLRHLGRHPKSGVPMSLEYRSFWLDGEPLLTVPYWAEASYPTEAFEVEGPAGAVAVGFEPPVEKFREAVAQLDSRLVALDLAMTDEGDWIVVEVGDGQVSGLARPADARALYDALAEKRR